MRHTLRCCCGLVKGCTAQAAPVKHPYGDLPAALPASLLLHILVHTVHQRQLVGCWRHSTPKARCQLQGLPQALLLQLPCTLAAPASQHHSSQGASSSSSTVLAGIKHNLTSAYVVDC